MTLKWAISAEQEVVAVLATDPVTPEDVVRFVRALKDGNAMGYRKVFDLTLSARTWMPGDLHVLAEAFERAAGSGPRGAVAIIARSDTAQQLAFEYEQVSGAKRPFAVFTESEEARRWLDGLLEAAR